MDIVLDKKDATNASLKVTVSEADYKQGFNSKLKEYSKKVQLKGFRPGKVPTGLVKKMYGKSILVEEVLNVLNESINKYFDDNKLPLVGQPLPVEEDENRIDWDNQKEFEFHYRLGLAGDYDYDLSKIELTQYEIELEEKDVDEVVDNIRKQQGVDLPTRKK